MIIAKQKDLAEIQEMIAPYAKILMVGCGTCVTFCSAGGLDEVKKLAEDLVKERQTLVIETAMIPRQCLAKFIERLQDKVRDSEAVLSLACGNGVQAVAKRFPDKRVLPALNTQFIGIEKEPDVWTEMCMACGDCILWRTAGICPVTRCAKGLLNGPCGGSQEGRCEVSKDIPCAWQEIYHGLKRLGLLDYLKGAVQIKAWRTHPGRLVREEAKLQQEP
ncbi:MAG: methylenetetrahydrofolate reductase C-terminal domain-containing protein [Deltaproteobacteria bacterium]|nr:methylenetetrahydrofolate reductase C-terminal domain-containing protein [Deltaproteobacteria bacterium]